MKMKLGVKIGLGFGSLIVIACILGGIAVTQMGGVSTLSTMLAHEYAPEVDIAYNLDRYARRTMLAMRGFALTEDLSYLATARKDMEEVKKSLGEAEELAAQSEHLVKLKSQVKEADKLVSKYAKLVDDMEAADTARDEVREKQSEAAKIYMENVYAYLNGQNEKIKRDADAGASSEKIKRRVYKITTANDIIDLNNIVQLANWKAQAERDVTQLEEGLKYFPQIESKLNDLIPITSKESDKEKIKEIREAAGNYKSHLQALIKNWKMFDGLKKEQDETGAAVTAATRITIRAGLDNTDRIAKEAVSSLGSASKIMIWGLALALALGVVIAFFITRSITIPIGKTVAMLKKMSAGNISNRLKMANNDEIGEMAAAMDAMADNLTSMIRDIDGGVGTLSSSSTEMASIADQMAAGSETTVIKSNTVASAAEEMNSNMTSVAASMEEAATNVSTVASGAEQMSSSIAEIAENASKAKESANNAVKRTGQASTQVNELGEAAEEIGVVSETIKAISDKTNLLALNATIEAARAGEAGKGFAVVANEIKELAQQTADATGDIAKKLQGIQKSTGSTVSEIEEVGKAINLVDEVVSAIAAAVEQQNAATKEISENVGQASLGLQEINENVNQSSEAAGQVAKEITEVNEAANEMSNSSAQVQQSAADLSKLSEQLKGLVGQFSL
ncbi:MAG: HAMP domain-containing protein [Desulfobulbaceae bacterium]|nr:HAMP domain-containing protein [Desulfobulbaceae bacterium]